ncbi:phage tail protein [Arcobacter aquimarinus]|uniref:Phage tail fibre protein N-terminal domain-containing protein n=1 Tax=Arcobacter aquimarinus TaxID=1315211 RepID=A0AAE7B623_9BACT|nr:phage tail protein [Arcobacter aquimarinus]QKE26172.1 hypothetical protein AAQM_1425 [Arcobacter aquimarinus]
MSNYYSILTNAGIQKEILSKQNGSSINLSKMAVGSGEITPTQSMTSLKSEKYRFNINSILQSETNPNHLIVEGVIPSNVGGFEISEIGIYLDDNTFYAVGNLPKTYKPLLDEGSAKDLTIKMFIEVSNTDNIVLKVDDSVVLATRNYVQNELKKLSAVLLPIGTVFGGYEDTNPNFIVAFGGTFKKSDYPDLWAYVQTHPHRFKTLAQWDAEAAVNNGICDYYCEVDSLNFRVPNLDGATVKFSSRPVGSFEGDAIRKITGTLYSRSSLYLEGGGIVNATGAYTYSRRGFNTGASSILTDSSTINLDVIDFDSSNVVPTAPENKIKNTAQKPLIVAREV